MRRPDPLVDGDDGRKPCCPACGRHRIIRRTKKPEGGDGPAWRCDECGERFDDPDWAEPEHLSTDSAGMAPVGKAALEWEAGT